MAPAWLGVRSTLAALLVAALTVWPQAAAGGHHQGCLAATAGPVPAEVNTYFVAGHVSAAPVWVHNACGEAWGNLNPTRMREVSQAGRQQASLVPRVNYADNLMRNTGPSFPNMRHHVHKFEVMKKQYGVMGKNFAEKAARAEEIIRARVAEGGGRFGPPVGQGSPTAIYYTDKTATYVFKPTGELWSIRRN